ncbi:hypothetical protein [Ectobacillus sp. sgz5001026]
MKQRHLFSFLIAIAPSTGLKSSILSHTALPIFDNRFQYVGGISSLS